MHQDDLERRLNNWARWYFSGGRLSMRSSGDISSIYSQGGRGRRAEASMPVIDGEAIDTHDSIERLRHELRDALRARYLRLSPQGRSLAILTERQVARRLDCSESTYRRRLQVAKEALIGSLVGLRRRHQQPSGGSGGA